MITFACVRVLLLGGFRVQGWRGVASQPVFQMRLPQRRRPMLGGRVSASCLPTRESPTQTAVAPFALCRPSVDLEYKTIVSLVCRKCHKILMLSPQNFDALAQNENLVIQPGQCCPQCVSNPCLSAGKQYQVKSLYSVALRTQNLTRDGVCVCLRVDSMASSGKRTTAPHVCARVVSPNVTRTPAGRSPAIW